MLQILSAEGAHYGYTICMPPGSAHWNLFCTNTKSVPIGSLLSKQYLPEGGNIKRTNSINDSPQNGKLDWKPIPSKLGSQHLGLILNIILELQAQFFGEVIWLFVGDKDSTQNWWIPSEAKNKAAHPSRLTGSCIFPALMSCVLSFFLKWIV